MPQARDGLKEEIPPIHLFVQLAHKRIGMERIKRIIQDVHIENALVSSTQGIGNFGILILLGFCHPASIPHQAQQVQQDNKQFNRRNPYIEPTDFINAGKSNIFIDIQNLGPATTEKR